MKILVIFLVMLGFLASATKTHAQSFFNLCPQNTETTDFSRLCSLDPATALPSVLTLIIIIAIILSLFYLTWGGIKWITSGGDKGNVETARNHIIAVIIGLILVFLAWFIINFVLSTFFGEGLEGEGLSLPSINTNGDNDQAPTIVATPTQMPVVVTPTPTGPEGEVRAVEIQVESPEGFEPTVTYEVE